MKFSQVQYLLLK